MNSNIHLKLDYLESISAKKEILLSEKDILQVMKHIRAYNLLRKQENAIKNNLKENIGHLKKEIEKIEILLPRDTHFHFPKEESEIKHVEITPKTKKIKQKKEIKSQIEQELEEIEAKLARLQ
jgi:hypothetical protein